MTDLNLERSTWELISVLYSDRVKSELMTEDDWDMEPQITASSVREQLHMCGVDACVVVVMSVLSCL